VKRFRQGLLVFDNIEASMKKWLLGLLFSSIILATFSSNVIFQTKAQDKMPSLFVGVDVAYENMTEIKNLVDEISPYTNTFVIGCSAISHEVTRLEETCQYLYERGLFFIVYQEWPLDYKFLFPSTSTWTQTAKNRWGEHFLGLYYLDESGGKQLDQVPLWKVINNPVNYSDAGAQFNKNVSRSVNWFRSGYSNWTDISLFMSDYALYWFDYKAGYDVILTQLGWNYSRQLNVALCRGAAAVQDKEWGAIIPWTYTEPPYIENGTELYKDMVLAYDNGAKYIIVFDSNEEYTQGILKDEHLAALKQFWHYAQDNPRNEVPQEERVAYVLPKDYAYGFRGPNDKVWGLWEADDFAYEQSVAINDLLVKYGSGLDIIYGDGSTPNSTNGYQQIIYWNQTGNSDPVQTPIVSGEKTYSLNTIYAATLFAGASIAIATSLLVARRKRIPI
jgi:hypothetical protein